MVSVIMPVFNGRAFIDSAINSVLEQGAGQIQFIVVDDGSTDGTAEMLAAYGPALAVITQSNKGPPVARNAGLRQATGDYVAFIDADELWTAGRLQRQLDYLEANREVDIIHERMQHIRRVESRWVAQDEPCHTLSLSTALFRRRLFDRIGLLDESMPYCDDVDWFLRAQRARVHVVRHDDLALLYRQHDGNLTNRKDLVKHYTLKVLLKHRRAMD